MNAPLYLSRQNADKSVIVPAEIVKTLNNYDIDSIRHIYKFYLKNTNVILNIEQGMNEPGQIHSFLTAIQPDPVLIICSDSEITKWECQFEMQTYYNVIVLSNATDMIPDKENMIVLAPHSIIRRALHLRDTTWKLLVVQNIDKIIDLPSINKLKAKFRIAITKYNFVLNPNKQLSSKILKWTSSNNSLINSEYHLPNQWLRLSWHQYEDD